MLRTFRIAICLLLIGWMILIFSLSAETAETSSKTSGGFVSVIINILFPDFEELSENTQLELRETFQFIIRKAAHFTIYTILGGLAFLSIFTYKKLPFWSRSLSSAAFCLLYAVSDEIHQLLVPGRSGEIRDVFIDFCGALLGIAVLILTFKFSNLKFVKKYI